ncbi:hypothetical protein [Methylobacterium sp. 10]|uniref:hypothetical protein n=1 Tax=Methylobacterium sp. 10 TaxID=1101191 RepID=UPI0004BBBBAE|nr:hypothetical protein [Methylobacterium sp. 10]
MNLDGAVNAKAEVFLRAFKYSEVVTASTDIGAQPTFSPQPGTAAYADIVKARRGGEFDPKEKIAVGVLRRSDNNDRPSDLKLGLFVQHKKLLHHPVVEAAQRIAKGEAKIIVTGRVRRQVAARADLCRPLLMGESVGHHRVTAGTIGCFGIDGNGDVGMVSNNHVLAHTNRAKPGDVIVQPGRLDHGDAADATHRIAKLRAFVPIDFDPSASNLVDCAFALLDDPMNCDARRVGHDSIDPHRWNLGVIEDLILDQVPVKKVGRTTRLTEGLVEAIDVDNVRVQMISGARSKYAIFNRQMAISGTQRPFSKGGDSGSLICTAEGRPVALLFAGTETGGRNGFGITYANPIRTVLDALDIDLYTGPAGA